MIDKYVEAHTCYQGMEVTPDGVLCKDADGNEVLVPGKSVICAVGHALRATFDRLRSIGIRIAMDDFGTGYSSLGLLAQSPADIVKIDRLFIKDIHREAFNRAFIDAVIELCHSVGIEVTVEGVEEPTELDAVRAIGADSIQGFFVSCPIPAHSFEERFITPQTAS